MIAGIVLSLGLQTAPDPLGCDALLAARELAPDPVAVGRVDRLADDVGHHLRQQLVLVTDEEERQALQPLSRQVERAEAERDAARSARDSDLYRLVLRLNSAILMLCPSSRREGR